MKRFMLILILLFASTSFADEYVKGHWKDTDRDGIKDTYVQPYWRSNRNNSIFDNYSTKGNINPYSGKEGTAGPFSYRNPFGSLNNSNIYQDPYKTYKRR